MAGSSDYLPGMIINFSMFDTVHNAIITATAMPAGICARRRLAHLDEKNRKYPPHYILNRANLRPPPPSPLSQTNYVYCKHANLLSAK